MTEIASMGTLESSVIFFSQFFRNDNDNKNPMQASAFGARFPSQNER